MTQEINLYVDKIVTPIEIENLLIDFIDKRCSRLMYGGLLLTYKGYGSCISVKILVTSWKSKEELEITHKEMISVIKKLQKKFHGNIIDVDGIMKYNSHKEHYEEE